VRRAGGGAVPGCRAGRGGQARGDLGRGVRGPADADIQPAVGELPVLLGHAGLDLGDDQTGVAGCRINLGSQKAELEPPRSRADKYVTVHSRAG
jgi:hypothetical protein